MKTLRGVIILVIKEAKVLLAKKGRGIGAGLWNGYGGKLEDVDFGDYVSCAIREFAVESGGAKIKREDLRQVAFVHFHNGDKIEFLARVYVADDIEGAPCDTDEMFDATWFPVNSLPSVDEFMEGDFHWLLRVISGEKLSRVDVWYDGNFRLAERGVEVQVGDQFAG